MSAAIDTQNEPHTLTDLLDAMDHAARGDTVSVRGVLEEFGDRSITPFILLVALLMVSPISGIIGMPTIAAIILVILSAQALMDRDHIWLPDFILRRKVASEKLRKAVSWMRKPCAFFDRHAHRRLPFLTAPPMRQLSLLVCLLYPLSWPPLEVLPMVTSLAAGAIALLAFGLFTRDGLYTLLGFCTIALQIGVVVYLLR